MRLFLSSYRFGDYADVLQSLAGENAKVGVITNAKDYKTDTERAASVTELFDSFKEINIEPTEIDLRRYFGRPEASAQALNDHNFIWIGGGNTFVLRRALKASGVDVELVKRIRDDALLYGGESAGAIIATPTLQGVEFGDDPYLTPAGYTDEDVWDGLGLVPYCIVPHYESGWEGDDRMIDTLEEANIPYKTLRDNQVIVINGESHSYLK